MSKTSEKVSWASRQVVIGLYALFSALSVRASVDQPDATKLSANGWHESGWLSHGVQLNIESGKSVFDNAQDMVFSPHYAKPMRKIILEAKCTAGSLPKRFLTVWPYVAGAEDPSRQFAFEVVENWGELTILSLDFAPEDNIDAIRIGLSGSENANWILSRLAVIYGEKTEDDDKVIREFAQQLPVPENLTLTGLTASSLSVSASNVADTVGYCFELTKLTGCPRTEIREDFVSAPALTGGWTFGETNAVKLSSYSGSNSTSVDRSAEDRISLKIEEKGSPGDVVRVEILSPKAPTGESFSECSFWCKRSSGASSEQIAVFGTSGDLVEWQELDVSTPVTTTGTLYRTTISDELNISRVKFVFTANVDSCPNCALDSLCVIYGGNEARELISTTTNATPTAEWQDLASGRYGYRVKALGATEGEKQFKDSSWTEEQAVDLAWADIHLSPPENLAYEESGDKLNLSWSPVAMADRYEVKVALADDPENPVATLVTKSASASVSVAELGAYVVTVTAVSPGGVSTASSSLENCTVSLGKVTGLEVEATAADTIAATWKDVPLAESYQAKLFKVTGEAGTEVSDYSKLPEGVWPEGWEHDADWLPENRTTSGPKFTYDGETVMTKFLPVGITRVTFVIKSNSSTAGKLANQHLQVEAYSEKDGDWNVCADIDVSLTTQTTGELSFGIAEDVRRLRFTALTRNGNYPPAIQLGRVSVSYGEYVRTEVASVGTKECAATYRGLDGTAKYVVVVTPQPSEGTECEASSVIIDLASEYFRPVGPVSIAGCKGVYFQGFDSLTNVTKETDLRRVPLENWQFFKGSGEAEKLFYTSGTNSTKGGVYCYSDTNRTTSSFMIGTVATSTMGSSIGLAFVNDRGSTLGAPTLTFTAVRRNEKLGEPYVLEWLVTDGPWSIGTESEEWKSLPLKEDEPDFCVTPEDCRIGPGQVIIFRWRQEKVSGGPMLGLDNVHVEFPDRPGFALHIR